MEEVHTAMLKRMFRAMLLFVVSSALFAAASEESGSPNRYGILYQQAVNRYFAIGIAHCHLISRYPLCNINAIGFLVDSRKGIDGHDKGVLIECSISPRWGFTYFKMGPSIGISALLEQRWNRVPPVEGDLGFPLGAAFFVADFLSIRMSAVRYLYPRNMHSWSFYDWKFCFNLALTKAF